MKKTLLATVWFFGCAISVHGQTLYSTTNFGGTGGFGTIIKFIPATDSLSVLKSFSSISGDGIDPDIGGLTQALDGKLYGTTFLGGSYGGGIIFLYDPITSLYKKLVDFNQINGANPEGLILAKDGMLYGTTSKGGNNDQGILYSFDPATSTFTKLMDFGNIIGDGSSPHINIVQASDGKLYGTTYFGGAFGAGTIFSFDPLTSNYTKLHDFDYINGSNPWGKIIQASEENFIVLRPMEEAMTMASYFLSIHLHLYTLN